MSSRVAGKAVHGKCPFGNALLQNLHGAAGASCSLLGTDGHHAPEELGTGKSLPCAREASCAEEPSREGCKPTALSRSASLEPSIVKA